MKAANVTSNIHERKNRKRDKGARTGQDEEEEQNQQRGIKKTPGVTLKQSTILCKLYQHQDLSILNGLRLLVFLTSKTAL